MREQHCPWLAIAVFRVDTSADAYLVYDKRRKTPTCLRLKIHDCGMMMTMIGNDAADTHHQSDGLCNRTEQLTDLLLHIALQPTQ